MARWTLPDPHDDFPAWYQELLVAAELAETGPVRGTMIIRPWAFAIWELMQAEVDRLLKAQGVQNVYFPLFLPQSYLEKEAEHVEGFSPELAVVTSAGGKTLQEPIVVRPTSETVFGDAMARWIQSYRDLPLALNQWANVVRWELRPRIFLRTSEFLWQEGHTAHAGEFEARNFAEKIHAEVYGRFFAETLAVHTISGEKTASERFAGAIRTLTREGMMGDGKALQLATSHELGMNFAQAFDIRYLDQGGELHWCWTTSWGCSTRMVGGLIMAHGDRGGLNLPPALAPHEVVILLVDDHAQSRQCAEAISMELAELGKRVFVDSNVEQRLGRRRSSWELKGVPIRLEVGKREVTDSAVSFAERHSGDRGSRPIDAVAGWAADRLAGIQSQMFDASRNRTEALTREARSLTDLDSEHGGFWEIPWNAVGEEGERMLKQQGLTVRCLVGEEGDRAAIVARAY